MDIVGRIGLAFLLLFVAFKAVGRRELSKMSPFELVLLLLIPEILSPSLMGDDHSITAGWIGAATVFSLVLLMSSIGHRFPRLGRVLEGEPVVLVRRGRVIGEAMDRERIDPEEVMSELRRAGLEDMAQVKWAILESDGRISIVPEPSAPRHGAQDEDDLA